MKKFHVLVIVYLVLLCGAFSNKATAQSTGDYQTMGSGNWKDNNSSPAIWQQWNGSAWVVSNSPAFATTATIYIRNGHTLTTTGSYGNTVKFIIDLGGVFNSSKTGTCAGMVVKAGGTLNLTDVFTMTTTGTFEIENTGTVNLNYTASLSAPASTIWQGIEKFSAGSNFVVNRRVSDNAISLFQASDITPTVTSGVSSYFGNLSFDLSTSSNGNWDGVFTTLSYNLTEGNLTFKGPDVPGNLNLYSGTVSDNLVVGKQLIVNNFGSTNSKSVKINAGTGNISVTVLGNFTQNASSQFVLGVKNGNTTLTINGDMFISGTNAKLVLYDNPNNSSVTNLVLLGNLSVTSGGSISNLNTGTNGLANTIFNFSNLSVKQLEYSSAVASSAVSYEVKPGAYVQLSNSNLILDNSSSFNVDSSGTFDFNWDASNVPLLVTQPASPNGSNIFTTKKGSILKITSAEGLSMNAATGNVQVSPSNRTIHQTAIFWYIGKTDQVTGNGLTNGSTPKLVYVNLADNSKTLTLTNDIGITGNPSLDPLGGKLEIQKGLVLGTSGQDFYGSGRLVMSDGEYRISTVTATPTSDYLPQLGGYNFYSLSGGTIQLNGSNAIQILSGKPTFYNLAFSGSNIYGSDYKGISSATTVTNNITISSAAIFDVKDKSFAGGNSGNLLTMTGTSRFITAGTGSKPDDRGTYSLAAGTTIEFSNSLGTSQNIRLNKTYSNVDVSGSNVANASTANGSIKFQAGATFRVRSGGTFKFQNDNGFTGTNNTSISNSNDPAIVLDNGSTIEYNDSVPAHTQIITPRTDYSNLTLSSASPKTMSGSPAIAGNFTVSGGAVSLPSTILFNGSSGTQNITGLNYNNITFSNAGTKQFTSDASVAYNCILTLNGGTLALVANNITLKAGIGVNYPTTAIVGPIGAGAAITYGSGQFVVERYIPGRRAFRFMSSPVSTASSIKTNWMEGQNNTSSAVNNNSLPGYGTHVTGYSGNAGGFDVTQNNSPSLFTYNNNTQAWSDITSTNGTITAGFPYRLFVRGDRSVSLATNTPTPTNTTLRTSGSLVIGPVTYNTASTPPINGTVNNYSLMGNPFAAPVNWNTLPASQLSPTYYTWDPNLNTRGAYASYNGFNNQTSPNISDVTRIIQPGQAFFVQATGSNPTLQFRESDKVDTFTRVFRSPDSLTKLSVELIFIDSSANEIIADGVTALFDESFSTSVGVEDSYKFTNLDENLAIDHDNIALSIEGRPNIVSDDTIQLKIWQYRHRSYFLKLDASNFLSGTSAFVKDSYLNLETPVNVSDSTIIPFSLTADSASYAPRRFSIIFKPANVLPVTITKVTAYQKEKGVQVDWYSATEVNISKYEIEKSINGRYFEKAGTVVASGNNASLINYSWFDLSPYSGDNFYRIRIVDKSGVFSYSAIVKVSIAKPNGSLLVYPNPVRGNTINLHLENLQKGRYFINLYNDLGQKVSAHILEHDGISVNYNIRAGIMIVKGIYRLNAVNDKGNWNTIVVVE